MTQKTIHDARYKALIAKLADARKKQKMTQKQLADKLGKPQSYVAKYELCERRLDVIELDDICEALSINSKSIL